MGCSGQDRMRRLGDRPGCPREGPARRGAARHEASRRRAWEGPVGSGGDQGREGSCRPLWRLSAQAVALQFDAVRGVKNAVQDGVAEGGVADDVVP